MPRCGVTRFDGIRTNTSKRKLKIIDHGRQNENELIEIVKKIGETGDQRENGERVGRRRHERRLLRKV